MILQQCANGIFLGAVYALFAIGYTLVFGVLDILNLAHAAIFMAAAFTALWLVGTGVTLPLAILAAVAFAGLLGVLLDRVAFAPLRRRNAGTLVPLISSIGAAIIIQGKGSHCDPDMTDAFIAIAYEFKAIADLYTN